ncbi:hypothetical protein [Streptococcus plurextorum]|uniref:hypothetical protein n=1 Tax=Streptococcus plurextorum TaxID=456876 RepID=UPI0003F50693|nr:hypothetical protein [Streptococcus plurextorum]
MIETLDESDKTALKETLSLPHDYQKSGYQVSVFEKGTYGKEYYVMSPVINQLLQEGKNIPLLFKAPNYNLPAVLLELLPKIMKVNLSKNRFMNNGKLVRQHQSLLVEHFKDGGHIGIGKVGYYDGQCSHEIVYKNFYHQQEIGLYFSGKTLLSNEDNELYSLTNSRSANFLGASTLVITADRHLLIARQGANSKANRNRYAPSGSGSVEWQKDYRQLNPSNLDALIISAMEREFCEEWGLSDKDRALMATGLIGYARLLERGGKPDYFGITYIDKGYEELVASQDKMSYREIGLQQKSDIKLTFTRIDDIYQQLERFCQQSVTDDLLSIQVYLITEIIKEMTVEGRFTAFMNGLGLFD